MTHIPRPINWNHPLGRISPPEHGATFEQDGHYYDQDGNEIYIKGWTREDDGAEPATAPAAAQMTTPALAIPASGDGFTIPDLLLMVDDASVTFQFWRKQARDVLPDCPAKKEEIIAALKDAIVEAALAQSTYEPQMTPEEEQPQTPPPQGSSVQSWEGEIRPQQPAPAPAANANGAAPQAAQPQPAQTPSAQTPANGEEINLQAWGEGKADYRFAEVQKAIRTQYNRQVTETRDAVDFLIEQEVVAAEAARRVEPSAAA